MKTRAIPSICMLAAGLIRCIMGAMYREEIKSFLWSLILVMVIFYALGSVVKLVLDRNFKDLLTDAEGDEEEEKNLENIEENKPDETGGESVSVKEKNPEFTEEET